MGDKAPVHDCEVQGPDTPMQLGIDVATGKKEYMCLWCEMAKKLKGKP